MLNAIERTEMLKLRHKIKPLNTRETPKKLFKKLKKKSKTKNPKQKSLFRGVKSKNFYLYNRSPLISCTKHKTLQKQVL